METLPPSPMRPGRARAAALALLLSLAGCGGCGKEAAPAPPAVPGDRDPAVEAALAARPDLAKSRVFLLGLDGCDPLLVRDLVKKGRLPNFKRLMDEGAFGPLQSQQPMLSPLLWTTVATGKWPTEHGVLDFMIRDPSDPSKRVTVESRSRRVEAIWDIAGRYGSGVGVVGWLASHPAEKVHGFAVSERTEPLAYLYNQQVPESAEGKTWPPELLAEIAPLRREPSAIPFSEMDPFLGVTEEQYREACKDDKFHPANRTNNMRLIYAGADNFRRISLHLWKDRKPRLLCAYFEMLDAVCHNFMAYREPVTWKPREPDEVVEIVRRFRPDIDADWVRAIAARARGAGQDQPRIPVKPGQEKLAVDIAGIARGALPERIGWWKDAVDASYEWTDRMLGEVMAAIDADTVLLVVSDHGWLCGAPESDEPSPDARLEKPPFDAEFNAMGGGGAFHRPYGILGAFGKGVKKGHALPKPPFPPRSVAPGKGTLLIDVAPTVLAILGFPKAEDMPGRVLAEVFDTGFPTAATPTYETGRSARIARERLEKESRKPLAGPEDPGERDPLAESMKEMAAVGYVGSAEDADFRAMDHLAASFLEQGRVAEAEEALREALKAASKRDRPRTHARLGGILRDRKDAEGAAKEFEAALAEQPGFIPALVGLALLAEDREEPDAFVEAWERVVAAKGSGPEHRARLADALRRRNEAIRSVAGAEAKARADLQRAFDLLVAAAKEGRKDLPPEEAGAPAPGKPEDPGLGLSPNGRNILGMVLLRAGRLPLALEQFKAAADKDPKYLRPRNNLGVLHLNAAAASFEEASRTADPEKRASLEENGRVNREEALRRLREVLAIHPRYAKALYNRAEVLFLLPPRDPVAAAADLEAALEADPDYRKARALLERIRAETPK